MKYKIPYPSIIPSVELRKQIKKDLKIRIQRPKPRVWVAGGGKIVAFGGRSVDLSVTGRIVGPRMVIGDYHPMDPISAYNALSRMQAESRLNRYQAVDMPNIIMSLHDDCFICERERRNDPLRIGARQLLLDIEDMYEKEGIQEIELESDFVIDLRVFSNYRQKELEVLFTEMCKKGKVKKVYVKKLTFGSVDDYTEVSCHPQRDAGHYINPFARYFGETRRSAKMSWDSGRAFSRIYERKPKLGRGTKFRVLKAGGKKRKRAL